MHVCIDYLQLDERIVRAVLEVSQECKFAQIYFLFIELVFQSLVRTGLNGFKQFTVVLREKKPVLIHIQKY